MKKLVLSIGLGPDLGFGAGAGALAANRADETARALAIREGDNASAASRWLLFVDEPLAPETSTDQSAVTNLLAANRRLRFIDASLYSETSAVESAVVASPGAHGEQERADMAQPYTADNSAVPSAFAAIRRLLLIYESMY